MAEKLLLCVSNEQATVGRFRSGKLGDTRSFPADERGLAAFDEYLAHVRDVPVYVMVDAVEEEYRFETLPHAGGRDRAELVSRRLRQVFRGTPYATASLQGRDSGKRRDDQYLFLALTNPELAEEWLRVIRTHDMPVAGVHLLPLVLSSVIARLGLTSANVLLISRHASGMRLSFFREGRLRISRLTSIESAESRNEVSAQIEEIANTRLYLHALRVMTLEEPLVMVVLDRDDSMGPLAQSLAREVPNAQVARVARSEIVSRLGVPAATLADVPDALYLHLLGAREPEGNLAPVGVTARFRQYRARRALWALGGAVALVTLAWTGINALQIYDLRSQREYAQSQTTSYQQRYEQDRLKDPPTPASVDAMVRAVETERRLRATARDPALAMTVVSRALEAHPRIAIKSLGWSYLPAREEAGAGGAPRPASPPGPVATGKRSQTAWIEAEIRPFSGDYRAAIAEIQSFAAQLGADPAVSAVRVQDLPLNVSPNSALSGSTADDAQATSSVAPFRLTFQLRRPA